MKEMTQNPYRQLIQCLDAGEQAVLVTVATGGILEKRLLTATELRTEGPVADMIPLPDERAVTALARTALENGTLSLSGDAEKEWILCEPYAPEPQLIVFGGGHIAVPLVEFAARVGFRVTVVDDRPSFANSDRFPQAERVLCTGFADSFSQLSFHRFTHVVIVTRGHRHDQLCLQEVLAKETAYLGMIGSRRRLRIVFDQLQQAGFDPVRLAAVHAPIGIPIDAATPAEIAVSILAELISVRRKHADSGNNANQSRHRTELEFDRELVRELAGNDPDPRVLITVLETKGSVPRQAGARMIVFPDGRIIGSIGGGCSEGAVIRTARDLFWAGGYRIQTVDLTGEAAEDEGMVCGGTMRVLIERRLNR